MCGFDEIPQRISYRDAMSELQTADRLIVEAQEMIQRFADRLAPADFDKAEAVILANSLNNFMRRDEPKS